MRLLALLLLTTAPLAAQEFRARFVDEDGAPVRGVEVNGVRSDSLGRVVVPLPGLSVNRYTSVRATSPGHATLYWDFRAGARPEELDIGEVTLEAGASLTGRIVDQDGDLLVWGWSATVMLQHGERAWGIGAQVDQETGEFHAEDLPPGPVTVWASKRREQGERVEIELEGNCDRFVELRYLGKDPGNRLFLNTIAHGSNAAHPMTVEVRDARGKRVSVDARQDGARDSVEVAGLGPGPWEVSVAGEAFEETTLQVTGRSGQRVPITLRGKSAMRLSVIDGGTRRPEHGWRIGVDRYLAQPLLSTPQSSGTVVDGLFPEPVTFELLLADGKTWRFEGPRLEPGRVVEHEVRLPQRIDLTMACTDRDQEPWPGVEVTVREPNDPLPSVGVTGPDGRVQLTGLFPGEYLASIQWDRAFREQRRLEAASSGVLRVPAPSYGSLVADFELLELPPASASLFLRVDRHALLPITPRLDVGRLRAGSHQLDLAVGVQEGGVWQHAFLSLDDVHVAPEEDATLAFDLREWMPAELALSVTVDGGLPSGVGVTLTPLEVVPSPWSFDLAGRPAGQYASVCAPGTYHVGLVGQDGTWVHGFGEDVRLAAGERLALDVSIERVTRRVRFLRPDGRPLSSRDITMFLTVQDTVAGRTWRTDEHGHADVTACAGSIRFQLGSNTRSDLAWPPAQEGIVEVRLEATR